MARPQHNETVQTACDIAEHVLAKFEKVFPHDQRPRKAIEAGRLWSYGALSMADARKAAFAAHAAARDARQACEPQAEAAARSAGHAAATAQVMTHAAHARNYALKASDDPTAETLWQQSVGIVEN